MPPIFLLKAAQNNDGFSFVEQQNAIILKVLESLQNHRSAPSQREIARKLDISLGSVNAFLHKLKRDGLIKFNTEQNTNSKYMITPKGFLEKTRLTYLYIQASYQNYINARTKLQCIIEQLNEQKAERVAFYGMSEFAKIAFLYLQENGIEFTGIVDDIKTGKPFFDQLIKEVDALGGMSFDKLLITKEIYEPEAIVKILKKNKIAEEKCFVLS